MLTKKLRRRVEKRKKTTKNKLLKGGAYMTTSIKKDKKINLEYIENMKKISLVDFMLSLIQELVTFTIAKKSIYDYMIDYINRQNIKLENNTRLVVIQTEIEEDYTYEIFDEILDSEIEKHKDEVTVRLIYHKFETEEEGTHYLVKEKNTQQKKDGWDSGSYNDSFCDPYKRWQNPGTQGYCQMYSFFCALSNHIYTKDDLMGIVTPIHFYEVETELTDIEDYSLLEKHKTKFAKNNYLCTQKTLDLIEYICEDESYPELGTDILQQTWNTLKGEIRFFIPDIFTVKDLFNILESFTVDDWLLFGKVSEEEILTASIENRAYTDLRKINFYFMHNHKRINFKPLTPYGH